MRVKNKGIKKYEIPESEELVMSVIWKETLPPDLMTILEAVNKKYGKEWKPQTVSTFIHRLIEKGFLTGNRKGRYTYYAPIVSKEDYQADKVEYIINVLYDGDIDKFKENVKALK